jgi:hypothetical protein
MKNKLSIIQITERSRLIVLHLWTSCLETARVSIPQINTNVYSVHRNIVLKIQKVVYFSSDFDEVFLMNVIGIFLSEKCMALLCKY